MHDDLILLGPERRTALGPRVLKHRWWISLAYCLAAVLSQGLHVHGDGGTRAAHTAPAELPSGGSCPASGHYEADPGGFAEPIDEHCPACQFHSEHQAPLANEPCGAVAGGGAQPLGPVPTLTGHPLIRPSTRAPPTRA